MGLSIENLLTRSSIDSFIQNDPVLNANFTQFNDKGWLQVFSKQNPDERRVEYLTKLSEFSSKLFKIVQAEAANGHLGFTINDKGNQPLLDYFELPNFKDTIIGKAPISLIVKQLFASHFQIEIEADKRGWVVFWQEENPLLPFEPNLEPCCSSQLFLKAYLKDLCTKAPHADITFLIEGEEIRTHKLFLSQCPLFKTLLEKECNCTIQDSTGFIELKGYKASVFKAMLQFLYVFEINEQDAKEVEFVIELYRLASFMQYKPLIDYCRVLLRDLIDEKSLVELIACQKEYSDEFLLQLCQWFVAKNFNSSEWDQLINFPGVGWDSAFIDNFIQEDLELSAGFVTLTKQQGEQTSTLDGQENTTLKKDILERVTDFTSKLFRIVQAESAKGNNSVTINTAEQTTLTASFALPCFKSLFFEENPAAVNIVRKLFKSNLNVEIEASPTEWSIHWQENNPALLFQPSYQSPLDLNLITKAYRTHWCVNAPDGDVIFMIGEEKIRAHKIFLEQSSFFRNILEQPRTDDHISMTGFNAHVFRMMLHFFYTFEVNERDEKDIKLMSQLYMLAQSIQFLPLIEHCQGVLKDLINEKDFLYIAFCQEAYPNKFLFNLCKWFLTKNFDYGREVDISHFNVFQLLETYRIAEKFSARELKIASLTRLKELLDADIPIEELDRALADTAVEERLGWLNQFFAVVINEPIHKV